MLGDDLIQNPKSKIQSRKSIVGIVANPASGKDIRRLVAHGSVFDNNEKSNILQRILLALDALEVDQVSIMPDYYGLGERALRAIFVNNWWIKWILSVSMTMSCSWGSCPRKN